MLWTMRFPTALACALITIAGVTGCAHCGHAPVHRSGPHALLIGCSTYSKLGKSAQLIGPGNDVELFRRLLTDPPYYFAAENIVTLSDASGTQDTDLRPTRANIEREFRHLADVVRPGEQVVITFSGHGSQQPDQDPPDPSDPEPDGMDEILLPADVGGWDARHHTMTNVIVDDELKVWLQKIAKRGALLWVVIDACHSGSVIRGETAEVNRRVAPEELGVPRVDLERAARRQAAQEASRDVTPLELASQVPELVAIYAALPSETTPEGPWPDCSDPKPYGLLSYTLGKSPVIISS